MAEAGAEQAAPAISKKSFPGISPLRHLRLLVFFVVVAALGTLGGVLALRRSGDAAGGARAEWILACAVGLSSLLGFLGVLVHRLRVLPILWRETESYLLVIQRESQRYRALMEGAADMLLTIDPASGGLREWNTRAREELGLPQAVDTKRTIAAIVAPEDLARVREALARAASAPGQAVELADVRILGSDRRVRMADVRLAAIALEDDRIVQVALRDRTRQKEMEQELPIRERLASVGLLTAGVAHEINNPLEGIGNYLRLLESEQATPEDRRRYLELVRHGLARIREIVRDLLRFARPAAGEGVADLALVVARARNLSAYTQRVREVEVQVHGLEAPLMVVGDAGRLEQVVLNLLLNAATAMAARGTIRISARRATDDQGSAIVELAVEDQGPGIAADQLERIFDPFFTTTGGTGLGLSVSYGIVRAHGGTLSAANREGGGARFTVRLPWVRHA